MSKYKNAEPPWEFLLSASRNSLQSFELNRLSHAANLKKEIGALLDQWLAENAAAMLARFLMDPRARTLNSLNGLTIADLTSKQAQSASDNLLADATFPPSTNEGNL